MHNSITKLTSSHSLFRPIFPFQSYKQALSWSITLTLLILLIYLASCIFQLNPMPSHIIFISVITGSSFSLFFALPFEFQINFSNEKIEMEIHEKIELFGYIKYSKSNNTDNETRFRQKGPIWSSWRESDIIIKKEGKFIKIIGPLLLISKIRTRILTDLK